MDGSTFDLSQQSPKNFTVLAFYRGFHCPKCKDQLEELNSNLSKFKELGAQVVAVSMDTKERATKSQQDWNISDLTLGYGITASQAMDFGLYLSEKFDGNKIEEPQLFSEPGLFLIRPDQTLYAASIQTMPFARPSAKDLLGAISYINENGYPARGNVSYENACSSLKAA